MCAFTVWQEEYLPIDLDQHSLVLNPRVVCLADRLNHVCWWLFYYDCFSELHDHMDKFYSYICHASVEYCTDTSAKMDRIDFYIVEHNVYNRKARENGEVKTMYFEWVEAYIECESDFIFPLIWLFKKLKIIFITIGSQYSINLIFWNIQLIDNWFHCINRILSIY